MLHGTLFYVRVSHMSRSRAGYFIHSSYHHSAEFISSVDIYFLPVDINSIDVRTLFCSLLCFQDIVIFRGSFSVTIIVVSGHL